MEKTAAQAAYQHFCTKIAAGITPELIAQGIAGKPGKLTPEDVNAYIKAQQAAAEKANPGAGPAALKGMGIGALTVGLPGAMVGGAAGGGYGALAGLLGGGLFGGGIGAGLGALHGAGQRRGAIEKAVNQAKFLGNVAQTGQLPVSESELRKLIPHATGVQKAFIAKGKKFSPEKLQEAITEQLLKGRKPGAFEAMGKLNFGNWNHDDDLDEIEDIASDPDLSDWERESRIRSIRWDIEKRQNEMDALRRKAQGYFSAHTDAQEHARELHDLYSRGYGTLADRLRQHIS